MVATGLVAARKHGLELDVFCWKRAVIFLYLTTLGRIGAWLKMWSFLIFHMYQLAVITRRQWYGEDASQNQFPKWGRRWALIKMSGKMTTRVWSVPACMRSWWEDIVTRWVWKAANWKGSWVGDGGWGSTHCILSFPLCSHVGHFIVKLPYWLAMFEKPKGPTSESHDHWFLPVITVQLCSLMDVLSGYIVEMSTSPMHVSCKIIWWTWKIKLLKIWLCCSKVRV